ncbi:MAG TPA: hypothetical protein VLA89_13215 [Gemmatimonadales bacterium]|nr:hypothetical protein [Gemmatimonadales bacterium]
MKVSTEIKSLRILDFDIECVATGYGDPNWVPQKVTAVAWSWIGSDAVEVRTNLMEAIDDVDMLDDFLVAYDRADMLTGHNIVRYDLPVLQGELLRRGRPGLSPKLVQDTMRIIKTKGLKKGQDNIGALLRVPNPKMALSWQEWQDAYDEPGWKTVVDRVCDDVIKHKLMRQKMLDAGWLKPPTQWRPR